MYLYTNDQYYNSKQIMEADLLIFCFVYSQINKNIDIFAISQVAQHIDSQLSMRHSSQGRETWPHVWLSVVLLQPVSFSYMEFSPSGTLRCLFESLKKIYINIYIKFGENRNPLSIRNVRSLLMMFISKNINYKRLKF